MPLRYLIRNSPETLSDVLVAAEDRYQEAEELLVQQHFDGCVYLFGYAAEMWLKVACLRLRGLGQSAAVKPALGPMKAWMKVVAPSMIFTDYHDLAYLAECVRLLRVNVMRPLPVAVLMELQARVTNGLHEEWIVDMRYRRSGLTAANAWTALQNAWWLRTNWVHLL